MTTGLYLQFVSQSAGTLTFADGTTSSAGNYRVTQWEQAAGAWTDDGFEPVREVIYFDVFSSSLADLNHRLRVVELLCSDVDQYNRYPLGSTAPQMDYSGVGMASATASANRARLIEARFYPAQGYPVSASGGFVLTGNRLEIVRTPYWTRFYAQFTNTQYNIPNGLAATSTTNNGDLSELVLSVSGLAPNVAANGGTAYLVLGTSTGVRQFGVGAATATGWSAVNDAANNAVNTNVLRYTPTGTAESQSGTVPTSPNLGGGVWAIYFSARNNSATTSFLVRFRVVSPGTVYVFNSPLVPIPANATQPQYYFGGIVSARANLNGFAILATASAASGSLDFDNVVFVNLQDNGRVLGVRGISTQSALRTLTINPSTVTEKEPVIDEGFGILGDARLFFKNMAVNGRGFRGVYLKCTGTSWRETFVGVPTNNNWTFTSNQFSHVGQ